MTTLSLGALFASFIIINITVEFYHNAQSKPALPEPFTDMTDILKKIVKKIRKSTMAHQLEAAFGAQPLSGRNHGRFSKFFGIW